MATRAKVLIAHFDPHQLEQLQAVLDRCDVDVLVARDGHAALSLAEEHRPELALLATLLPGLNGFEVCRRLGRTSQGTSTSAILVTDVDDPYVRARARHVGAKRVVVEPLSEAQVRELIEMPWEAIDPLEISSRKKQVRTEELISDLMGTAKDAAPSLLSKVTDALTGLVCEEFFLLKQEEEIKRAGRYHQPVSMLTVEVANLDSIVKLHGRRAGDEAVLEVAGVFLCESRDVDVAGRLGRNRFVLLLPNTPEQGAAAVQTRVADALSRRMLLLDGQEVELVVHAATVTSDGGVTQQEFNELAQQALIKAARRGTNHNSSSMGSLA